MRVRGLGAPRVRAAPIGDPSGGHASGGVRDRALRGRGVLCPLFLLLSFDFPRRGPPAPSPRDLCDPHRDEISAQKHASRVDMVILCGVAQHVLLS